MNWYKKAAEETLPYFPKENVPGAGEGYGLSPEEQDKLMKSLDTMEGPDSMEHILNAYELIYNYIGTIRGTDLIDDQKLSEAIAEATPIIESIDGGGPAVSEAELKQAFKNIFKAMVESEEIDLSDTKMYQDIKGMFPGAFV